MLLSNRLKFLRDLVFRERLGGTPGIYFATVYVTYACNARCLHCYGKYGDRFGAQINDDNTLSLKRFKEILDNLERHRCRYVAFLGGEPLMHPQIGEFIDEVINRGMELSIVTNGTMVRKHLAILDKPLTLCFSIDGEEEANDYLRGKGAYRRSIQGIEEARKLRHATVHVNACIHRESIHKMDGLFEFAKENDVYLGFCPLMYQSYASEDEAYLRPDPEDFPVFYRKVIELKKQGYPIIYSNESYETLSRYPDFDHPVNWTESDPSLVDQGFPICRAGRNFVYIGVDGNLYPCSQLVGVPEFTAKNVFTDGFDEAWAHARNIPCRTCTNIGFLDITKILNMRFNAMMSMAGLTLKERLFQSKRFQAGGKQDG